MSETWTYLTGDNDSFVERKRKEVTKIKIVIIEHVTIQSRHLSPNTFTTFQRNYRVKISLLQFVKTD